MISRKFENCSNLTGKNIEKIRKSKHQSKATLSDKLMMVGIDINYDGIYKIEKARRIVKDFELAAIAKILEVSETELLQEFKEKLDK